jgi:DNA-binding NtrC family response regulator
MIMPQIGGLALSKVIRQEQPRLPIVAISGYYEKVVSAVHKPEFDTVHPKPLTLETLKTTLKDVFSEKDN